MKTMKTQYSGLTIDTDKARYFFSKQASMPMEQGDDHQLARGIDPNEQQLPALRNFVQKNNLHPSQFEDDELVLKQLEPRRKRLLKNVAEAEQNNYNIYGKTPITEMQGDREKRRAESTMRHQTAKRSLENTYLAAQRNPEGFEEGLATSRKAEQNLSTVNHDRNGGVLGGLAGAAGGGLLGARQAMQSGMGRGAVGTLGVAGGLLGAGAGALSGYGAGRLVNEQVTGSKYNQIKKPYEVAYSL